MLKIERSILILSLLLFLLSAPLVSAEENRTQFAYITDAETPHNFVNNSTYSLNVSTYYFPLNDTSINADLILIDVSESDNITKLSNAIDNGSVTGRCIALTQEASSLSDVSQGIQDNSSLYWTWTNENLQNLLVYAAVELDGRDDLVTYVEQPMRTSVLLVVLPNHATILGVMDELSEYGIDCQFANLTALSTVARDQSQADFVNAEIDAWEGDIIFEFVADAQYDLYKDHISAAGDRGVKVLGVGGFSSAVWHSRNVEDGDAVLGKLFSTSSKSPGYWRTVLPENLVRMFIYVTNEADNRPDLAPFVKPTMTVPSAAIYHPDAPSCTYNGDQFEHLFLTREDYNEWYVSSGHYNASDKWIGISMYYRDYQEGKMHTEDAMIRKLEEDGYNVIASYVPWNSPINHFYDNSNETYKVDAIVSFLFFGGTGPSAVLEISDVPVLKAVSLSYQTYPQWERDPYGLNGAAMTWKLDQPEMDGVICPIAVEAQFTEEDYVRYPIMDRVERILGQAESYADLRHTPNRDKKIAIIYFNHPPGKQDVGASYLNLFESLELMLDSLESADYTVENMSSEELHSEILLKGRNIGSWAPGELDALVEEGLKDDSIVLLDSEIYEGWFAELPEEIRSEVTETWGAPPGEMMVVNRDGNDYIVLPMIKNGNVILTPQPARGWEEDVDSLYHDLNIPVPHQYIAFYLWLQHSEEENGFGADALVHVGRHGTHEWLPGKMVCLNNTSYSDVLLADMPNIYPYIVDGAGEGIQAKRRGYATLISHLTPPIAHSGLYGELTNLKFNLMRYQQYKQTNYTSGMEETRANVLAILDNSTVDEDLGIEVTESNFESELEELVEYIEDITSETIPYGTHIFGKGPEGQKAAMFIESMHADLLMDTSCELLGYNTTTISAGGVDVMQERWEAENLSTWLAGSVINCSSEPEFTDSVALHLNRSLDSDEVSKLNQTFDTASQTYLLLNCSGELASFIHALDGGYISPSEQGDPVNNPEVLPTGRNYYGFNSKKVPDPTTWSIGKELADEMLVAYYNEHGHFPEKIGVSMWSVETLRHNGVMESMVLRLMGAEPAFSISSYSGAFSKVYNDKVVVTPLDELTIVDANGTVMQRPRVDVVITTSGLYRDTLQYQMRLLDVAAHTVSQQNETLSDNYVRKHSLEMKEALLAMNESEQQSILDTYVQADPDFDGTFEDLAAYLSELRIFAPPPGGYGVGIEKEIQAGGTDWNSSNSTESIADLYIFRMANMYATDSEGVVHHLGNYESVFRENLKDTEIIFNSRSTSLYGVLDNDDFFQYVGGLSVAIEHVSGEAPEIKVVNLRGDPKVEGLDMFIARELRTRALNPLYLNGMMDSGYSGMKEIAEIVENLYGWQVTTPGLVEEYMWNDLYRTLVLDDQGLGIKDAFSEYNPHAYQSTTARLLEAIRKGYWDASEETIQTLTREYAESVAENGVTCCHHTCGNPLLDEYVRGIMSVPGVVTEDVAQDYGNLMDEATKGEIQTSSDPAAKKHSSGGGTGTAKIAESGSGNQTMTVDGGYGTSSKKQPKASSSSNSDSDYVEGYEMTKESTTSDSQTSSPSFSGADILGSIFVVLVVAVITIGFRRRRL